jgi:serine/threonine protein phosphatase PrpC
MLRFSGTGRTHTGLVRPDNEDSGFVGPTLLLVADGVGGNAGGEVASATTAYVVSAEAMSRAGVPATVLRRAVDRSQHQIAGGVSADPELLGMATTLTAMLTDGHTFTLAHSGDSRGYVFRDGDLVRVTTDHTWVQEMLDNHKLTEAEAAVHPWRNVVMRSVNGDSDAAPDVIDLDLRAGDRVLMCSDGVTDLVPETRIEQILGRYGDDAAVDALVDAALAEGGRDNITAVLATVVDGPVVSADGVLLGAVRDPANILDPAAVRVDATA